MSFRDFSQKVFCLVVSCFAVALIPAPAKPAVYLADDVNYTFENLTLNGNLVGQDNWLRYTGTSAALQVKTGTGYNETQVVQGNGSDTLVTIRPNDPSYSFPTHSGDKVVMQFDFQWDSSSTANYYLSLGAPSSSSSDTTKVTEPRERVPAFGVMDNKLAVRRVAGSVSTAWDYTINSTVNNSGDWLRVKFEIDPNYVFADDGSVGAGHIYYYNLTKAGAGSTDNNTGFQRLTSSTGAKLQLNELYSDVQVPATWDTMVFVKSFDMKGVQVDNFMPYVSPYVYKFEHIRNGASLSGNDNWSGGGGFAVAARDSTSFSTYPTKVAELGGSTQIAIRPNDERFSFPRYSASNTAALMQFDFQYKDVDGNYYFGLSADSIEDEDTAGSNLNERAPAFGVVNGQFAIRELGDGGNGWSDVFTYAISEEVADPDDWIRLRHVINFTANWNEVRQGFDGAGRLFYQNLTRGDTGFIELTTDAVNLRVTDMWADVCDPSTWDTMVLVKSGTTTGVQITNLIANNIPEPSSALLAALGLVGFGLLRRWRAAATNHRCGRMAR